MYYGCRESLVDGIERVTDVTDLFVCDVENLMLRFVTTAKNPRRDRQCHSGQEDMERLVFSTDGSLANDANGMGLCVDLQAFHFCG